MNDTVDLKKRRVCDYDDDDDDDDNDDNDERFADFFLSSSLLTRLFFHRVERTDGRNDRLQNFDSIDLSGKGQNPTKRGVFTFDFRHDENEKDNNNNYCCTS